jgi:uncharacterized RDD family membrane protein YckC
MRFFNRVKLLTPESVELEFTLAGIGNRAYALLVDYIVLGLILVAILLLLVILFFLVSFILGSQEDTFIWLRAIQILISFFVYAGYFVFFEVLWQGQTPGKRLVKIRVIRDDGRPISLQQAALRALFRPVDELFFLGVFLIILGKREKRLGDLVAGTLVVQEESSIIKASLAISESAKSLVGDLQQNAVLSNLLPEDFAVVREYLQRRQAMIPEAKNELSRKLADQVKEIIALEELPSGVSPNLFLEAVYVAYLKLTEEK